MKGAKARILALLQKRPATGLDIVKATGCMDYRKRISEMRADGCPILGDTITVKNRWGETCHPMLYYLAKRKPCPTKAP